MTAYALYNEIDDYAADWLENLIAANLIAPGIVDRRSIEDLRGDDLRGFRQVHFFAGIGVWSYALRCAGIPDDFPVWTGSPPCQPFSAAGQRGGVDDERHLWPALFHLIEECRPARFLGEQVASKDGLGWLDLVQTDLEAAGYALGALDTCSAGSGAPHIRQRLRLCAYDTRSAPGWMGNTKRSISGRRSSETFGSQIAGWCVEDSGNNGLVDAGASIPVGLEHCSGNRRLERQAEPGRGSTASGCGFVELGYTERLERIGRRTGEAVSESRAVERIERSGDALGLAHNENVKREQRGDGCEESLRREIPFGERRASGWLDDLLGSGLEGLGHGHRAETGHREGSLRPIATASGVEWVADSNGRNAGAERKQRSGEQRQQQEDCIRTDGPANPIDGYVQEPVGRPQERNGAAAAYARAAPNRPGPTNGFWRDADWLFCRDGKWRPTQPESFPLVDGSSFRLGSGSPFEGKSRQGMLKAYGNAVDAQATIDFIEACIDHRGAGPVVAGSLEDLLT